MDKSPPKSANFTFSCRCEKRLGLPQVQSGRRLNCPQCNQSISIVFHGEFGLSKPTGSLFIRTGPQGKDELIFLTGNDSIVVGKQLGADIQFVGERVSRLHCRFVPTNDGWRIDDAKSTNGVLVNNSRIESHELKTGDLIRIGEYELEFSIPQSRSRIKAKKTADAVLDSDGSYRIAEDDLFSALSQGTKIDDAESMEQTVVAPETETSSAPSRGSLKCPSCRKLLPGSAKICVDCGINVATGRSILIVEETNLDETYATAEKTITWLSWPFPMGIYPFASEAFGTRKPYAIRAIAIITVLASLLFFKDFYLGDGTSLAGAEYMLWAGDPDKHFDDDFLTVEDSDANGTDDSTEDESDNDIDPTNADDTTDEEVAAVSLYRPSQLITHAFLHAGLIHLAGNLLFMLVFGSRVNALIGNLATLIVYPLLAAGAALVFMESMTTKPMTPMLGASGAVMGLAGMYLVFFPAHKVHMAAWMRWGLFTGFHLSLRMWAMRGFWVVLFYIAFDVVFTAIGIDDGVAHWAHLGGFFVGIFLAFLLLGTRLITARGGDIFSMIFGKFSWTLIGKPNRDPNILQRRL